MRIHPLIAAATALGGIAAPAAAQYYPQPAPGQPGYGYPQQGYPQQGYPQQGYGYPQQQGGIAGVIGQLLGNRYAVNDRTAITQCASAASAQAAQQYRPRYQQPYGNAYGYQQQYPGYARVTAITNVERRNNNGLRVSGLIDSGMGGYNQQQYNGYNQQAYAQGDLRFRCNVDYQGRVTNIRINRNR